MKRLTSGRLKGKFPHISAGAFVLSVQASAFHYCTPKENLPTLESYACVEIAIFEGKDEAWVCPFDDPRFKDKPWAEEFEECSCPVAGHLSQGQVLEIARDLISMSGEGKLPETFAELVNGGAS